MASAARIVIIPCLCMVWFAIAGTTNAQNPYAIVFDFPDPATSKTSCATELSTITNNLYSTYIDNVVADTWWTTSTVDTIATTNKTRHLIDENASNDQHRRLPGCTARICRESSLTVIIALGCRTYCGVRRTRRNLRAADDSRRDQTSSTRSSSSSTSTSYSYSTSGTYTSSTTAVKTYFNSSTTTSFEYTYNQSSPAQGWKGNYAPYRGHAVATAFYNAVNALSSYCVSTI